MIGAHPSAQYAGAFRSTRAPPSRRGVRTAYTVLLVAAGAATVGLCWRLWGRHSLKGSDADDGHTGFTRRTTSAPSSSPLAARSYADSASPSHGHTPQSNPVAVTKPRESPSSPTTPASGPSRNRTTEASPTASSSLTKGRSVLRKASQDDDDDDLFAVPNGPRLFSQDSTFPERQSSAARAAPQPPLLSVLEAAAAEKERRDDNAYRATVTTKSGAAARAKDPTQVWSADIVRRDRAVHLLRALLRELEGTAEGEDDDNSSATNSDETDVSLNYHLASEFELQARDAVMDAMDAYEATRDEAAKEGMDEEDPAVAEMETENLIAVVERMAEYLDMSNEREKLMLRREQMYLDSGLAPPPRDYTQGPRDALFGPPSQAHDRHQLLQLRDIDDDDNEQAEVTMSFDTPVDGPDSPADFREALERQSRRLQAEYAKMVSGGGGTEMDRLLYHQQQRQQAGRGTTAKPQREESFEDDWDELLNTEEADFMAYLDQEDDAEHFRSPAEVRQARLALEKQRHQQMLGEDVPDTDDFRILASDGRTFEQMMNAMTGQVPPGDDADDDQWIDDDDFDDDSDDVEEEDEEPPMPWTMHEKAEFEEDLLTRVQDLIEAYGITDAMGQRARLVDEEARRRRHEAAAAAADRALLDERKPRLEAVAKAKRMAKTVHADADVSKVAASAEDEWETDEDELEDQVATQGDSEFAVEEEEEGEWIDEEEFEGEFDEEAFDEEEFDEDFEGEEEWAAEEAGEPADQMYSAPIPPPAVTTAKFERAPAVPPALFTASRSLPRGGSPVNAAEERSPSEPAPPVTTASSRVVASSTTTAATGKGAEALKTTKPAAATPDHSGKSPLTGTVPSTTRASTAARGAPAATPTPLSRTTAASRSQAKK